MADFTSPSMQYTVTFDDLDPDTEYTFTIRIVLRLDNTVDVIPAVTGSFLTQSNSELSTNSIVKHLLFPNKYY